MTTPYDPVFKQSISDPNAFWAEAAEDCHWYKKWDKVLDDSNKPFYRWFVGGEINTCYNAVDLHIDEGRGDQLALIYDSPVTDSKKTYTYNQLRDEVAKHKQRRPGINLHAHDSRGSHCHVGLRTPGSSAFGCLWRVRS